MVNQFDIVNLDPIKGAEKGENRHCVIVSNNLVNANSSFVWALPITSREPKYATDIPLKTKQQNVKGVIDSVQIKSLDIKSRGYKVVDQLQDNLHPFLLEAIEAHIKIIDS
ncbi:MAG TPA: type II toxin-antitoxin system PemK/MazF family toxin [Virgibacillus sp.]|nr:type II toxin-antitoxin system PemK/MazF family toxin [Virgibacillus sp.]HLR66976.1 type II toxin-antitoxin system PemK/MazF family toxin [Virgibacillus sp.]